MDAMLQDGDPERIARMNQVLMQMKKLDLAALQQAYDSVEAI